MSSFDIIIKIDSSVKLADYNVMDIRISKSEIRHSKLSHEIKLTDNTPSQ